jgi:hypothetical protein
MLFALFLCGGGRPTGGGVSGRHVILGLGNGRCLFSNHPASFLVIVAVAVGVI